MLRVSIADRAYGLTYGHIKELITFQFCDHGVAITLENRGRFLELILESNCRKTGFLFGNMTTTANFDVIVFFHCLSMFKDALQKDTLTVPQGYRAGTLIRRPVQRLLRAWN